MSNSAGPRIIDIVRLPAPSIDAIADRAPLPPPAMRVPALASPSLPPLSGAPIVPPMPRFSLDEIDSDAESVEAIDAIDNVVIEFPCPSIVESSPTFELDGVVVAHLGEELEPPCLASPVDQQLGDPTATTESPAIPFGPVGSPSEPFSAPPQIAMVLPTLPTFAAAPSPHADLPSVPASHQPSQLGLPPVTSFVATLAGPGAATQIVRSRSILRTTVRSFGAVLLAGALGAGAHLGFDWWEARDATAVAGITVDGSDLASWPEVDPPAIRYTDTMTTVRTVDGERSVTAHREISTGFLQASLTATDATGAAVAVAEFDVRGEQAVTRVAPADPWTLTSPADAMAVLGDPWTTDVFTVREMFPAEAAPYITVLESIERMLPVEPFVEAVVAGPADGATEPAGQPAMAISTDATSLVWQYRVIIDIESFRANEKVAFQEWERRLGRNAVARIEAWVDATGVVRQFAVELDGAQITQTVIGGSADSDRFATDPLLAPIDPATAVVDQ